MTDRCSSEKTMAICGGKIVVVAVFSELVSASDFPVYREFTAKIGSFGLIFANSGDFCSG